MPNISNLRAKGLFTFQNFLSAIPEGALLEATNVVIDRDGIIEPRRGIKSYGTVGTGVVKQLFTYKTRILAHYGSTLTYDDGTGTFAPFSGAFTDVVSGLRLKGVELNGNFYVTTSSGIKKISSLTSDLSTATVGASGGIKALDGQARVNYSTAGFFIGFSKVAYRIVWGTKDANNNLIYGSPSGRIVVTNYDTTSGNIDLTFSVPDTVTTNYFYQIYRTSIVTADPANLTTLNEIDPGDEMRLVFESQITSAEITLKQVSVSDITPEDFQSGGLYLYTNPTTGDGILQANEPPPVAKDIAVFKNTLFFANTRTIQTLDLSMLGVGDLEKGAISATSHSGTTLTLTSNGHGLANGALVAVVIPNSHVTFATTDVNTTSNTITINNHGLTDGQVVQFSSTTTLPAGLSANTDYYVVNSTTNTFKVSTTFGGSAVDITSQGTGTHSVTTFIINNVYTVANAATNTFDITVPTNTVITNAQGAYWFSSYITVTDGTTTNRYFFVGIPEATEVTFDTKVNTTDGSWFEISSAENEVRYAVWFDRTGSTTTPVISGKVLIRVNISALATAADIASATKTAIEAATNDFTIGISTATLTFVTANNGIATDAAVGTTAPGGAFSITVDQNGYGENLVKKFVRWSGFVSAGQSLDDTAQSLARVINRNTSEIIYGYYVSGVDDVPGLLNFQRRSLINSTFTITANNSSVGSLFNPDLTTAATSTDEEAPNRIYFSKYQQPEAVPIVNNLDIGPKDSAILRIVPLRDSLFIFKEDGIYRLTGDNSTNFSVVLFDNSVTLIASDTANVLNNQIYALTDGGVATVSETGVGIISRPIENIFKSVTTSNFPNFSTASFGFGYETERSYYIWTVTNQEDTVATQCFRYNTFTQSWTRWDKPQTCAVVNSHVGLLYLGGITTSKVEVERKALTRRDYADAEISLSFANDPILDSTTMNISSAAALTVGDALVQTQYLTIPQFNSILQKLDADPRIGQSTFDTDYFATLGMIAGDNLTSKMELLVAKLNADPGTSGGYSFSTTSIFADIQTEFNTMIGALNVDPKLKFSNYKTSTGTLDVEMTVTDFNKNLATVSGEFIPLFMVGPVTAFEGIPTSILWAPTSFGDPSMMKHVRESTIMFEESTFRGATASYSTDLSPSFESVDFTMDGNGSWGGFSWGNNYWGGGGDSIPFRTYIPRQKQRCRFIKTKFAHSDAFYKFSILGISYTFEQGSERAYRGNR
jgi:hypothetical protein